MADTMTRGDKQTRLNSVQPSMVKALIDVNPAELAGTSLDDAEVLSLIVVSIRRSGAKQEVLASMARVKPSQLSAALNGHGAFNVKWLWSWPAPFWNEFLPLLRSHKEQTDAARREHRRELLLRTIELLLVEVA